MTDPTPPPSRRLLVAVGPSPYAVGLIRWTHAMAEKLGASWIAVGIESESPRNQKRTEENLALARELGAEVVVVPGRDVAALLVQVAQQYNVSQIVVGKSQRPVWVDLLCGGSLADKIARRSRGIEVHIVPAEPRSERTRWLQWDVRVVSPWREYIAAVLVVAGVTAAAVLVRAHIDYWVVALLYLFVIVILGLRLGQGPILLAATLCALTWDYLFYPPLYTFRLNRFADMLMFSMFFVIALVTGRLTGRIRSQERAGRLREQRATALYQLTSVLASVQSADEMLRSATRQIQELFGARLVVLIEDQTQPGRFALHPAASYPVGDKELTAAQWAFDHHRRAGRFTEIQPDSEGIYLPLVTGGRHLGVMGVKLPPVATLSPAQRDMLDGFATQIALALEREQLRLVNEAEQLRAASDRLHRTLLDCVSHELKTPLAVIASATDAASDSPPGQGVPFAQEIRTAVQRLQRLVNNLLDSTRLESGVLRPQLDWCDLADLINTTLRATADVRQGRTMRVELAPDLPLVRMDFGLIQQALTNLVHNACQHTPGAAEITLSAGADEAAGMVWLAVADTGPGLREEQREQLFSKFFRGQPGKTGGLGLGLSIVRGFVEAHGGRVEAQTPPAGGARFVIYLPLDRHGIVPADE